MLGFFKNEKEIQKDINKSKDSLPNKQEKTKLENLKENGIIVLGASSKTEIDVYENAKQAVSELKLDVEVYDISDITEIVNFGTVASPPAIIINNKVVAQGGMFTKDEIKELIEKEL